MLVDALCIVALLIINGIQSAQLPSSLQIHVPTVYTVSVSMFLGYRNMINKYNIFTKRSKYTKKQERKRGRKGERERERERGGREGWRKRHTL